MGEVASTRGAAEGLDAALVGGSDEGTTLDIPPAARREMELTLRVGAMRWTEATDAADGTVSGPAHACCS